MQRFLRSLWWCFAVACLAFALVPFVVGCTAQRGARETDPDVVEVVRGDDDQPAPDETWEGADDTLHDLERAFALVRKGKKSSARRLLERAVHRFDDLAMESTPLEAMFASDGNKPYRGRPHERVLAAALLAALDIERGRCDLAVPTLRNAAWLDARANPTDPSDAVLVHALALRCIERMPGMLASDKQRVRDELRAALTVTKEEKRYDEIVALATRDVVVLELAGVGPSVVAEGVHGERVRVLPGSASGDDVVRIALGGQVRKHQTQGQTSDRQTNTQVWSSTTQATTISGRPYDEVLAKKAQAKSAHSANADANWSRARHSVNETLRDREGSGVDPKKAIAGALFATSSIGFASLANATDARADTRYVKTLFETASLSAAP